jgi:hypothetical protein
VVLNPPAHNSSASVVDQLLTEFSSLFAKRQKFALVSDLRNMDMPSADSRKKLANFRASNEALFRRYVVADSLIITSAVARGYITAINWTKPPPQPQKAFATVDAAFAWAKQRLAEENVPFHGRIPRLVG